MLFTQPKRKNSLDVSLYRFIDYHARVSPQAPAVFIGGREVSYAMFRNHIHRATGAIAAEGVAPGTTVALHVRQPYLYWLVTIACMRLGLPTVHVASAAEQAMFPGSVLATMPGDAPEPQGARVIAVSAGWLEGDASPPPAPMPTRLDPDAVCRLVLSSGTTGEPKQLGLTFRQLRDRTINVAHTYEFGPQARWLTGIGAATLPGFIYPYTGWYAGSCVILPVPTLLDAYRTARPTAAFVSPGTLRQLVDAVEDTPAPHDAPTIFVGGAVLHDSLNEAARAKLSPRLVVVYGSTEISTGAIAPAESVMRLPGCVGFAPPYTDVQVVDETHAPVPRTQHGMLRFRAEGMSQSYIGDAAASARAFRDGWFYPGDTGFLDKAGALHIAGRVDEVANVGGVKIAPERIDEALANFPGVNDMAAFAVPGVAGDAIWLAVVATDGFDGAAFRKRYREAFPQVGEPRVLRVPKIPRNEMGKAQRRLLREAAERIGSGKPH